MGNNGVMTAKDARIAVRVDPELKARIAQIVERTGIDEATLVRNCIEALCAHVERTGQISFPLTVNTAPCATPNSSRSKVYFCGPDGEVLNKGSHARAMARACRELSLPKITPHGFRAYYVTKRRRDKAMDSQIAAEIGDKTVDLISKVYGDAPGGAVLSWTPATTLPAWLRWQPDAAKIERIA